MTYIISSDVGGLDLDDPRGLEMAKQYAPDTVKWASTRGGWKPPAMPSTAPTTPAPAAAPTAPAAMAPRPQASYAPPAFSIGNVPGTGTNLPPMGNPFRPLPASAAGLAPMVFNPMARGTVMSAIDRRLAGLQNTTPGFTNQQPLVPTGSPLAMYQAKLAAAPAPVIPAGNPASLGVTATDPRYQAYRENPVTKARLAKAALAKSMRVK